MPLRNARHSAVVNSRIGPSGLRELRTWTTSGERRTSTHSPCVLKVLFRQASNERLEPFDIPPPSRMRRRGGDSPYPTPTATRSTTDPPPTISIVNATVMRQSHPMSGGPSNCSRRLRCSTRWSSGRHRIYRGHPFASTSIMDGDDRQARPVAQPPHRPPRPSIFSRSSEGEASNSRPRKSVKY
jgi:hypothetical protein